jgi:hypothetical protein
MVLSVKSWDEMRPLSARKRRQNQLQFNVDQLARWNLEKDVFINQFINDLQILLHLILLLDLQFLIWEI